MIPFIRNVQKRHIHRDRKQMSDCPGLQGVRRKWRGTANEFGVLGRGDENILKLIAVMMAADG